MCRQRPLSATPPTDEVGTGSGMLNAVQQCANAIGAAALGTAFFAKPDTAVSSTQANSSPHSPPPSTWPPSSWSASYPNTPNKHAADPQLRPVASLQITPARSPPGGRPSPHHRPRPPRSGRRQRPA
ncbi:hypothetical protein E1298_30810, partial [Actinomadura rubrisoli]